MGETELIVILHLQLNLRKSCISSLCLPSLHYCEIAYIGPKSVFKFFLGTNLRLVPFLLCGHLSRLRFVLIVVHLTLFYHLGCDLVTLLFEWHFLRDTQRRVMIWNDEQAFGVLSGMSSLYLVFCFYRYHRCSRFGTLFSRLIHYVSTFIVKLSI